MWYTGQTLYNEDSKELVRLQVNKGDVFHYGPFDVVYNENGEMVTVDPKSLRTICDMDGNPVPGFSAKGNKPDITLKKYIREK